MEYFGLRPIKSPIHSPFSSGGADAGVGRAWVPGHRGPRVPLLCPPPFILSNPLAWVARCSGSQGCPRQEGQSHLCEAAHLRSPASLWSPGTRWAAWLCFEHFLTPGHSFLGKLQVHYPKFSIYIPFLFQIMPSEIALVQKIYKLI